MIFKREDLQQTGYSSCAEQNATRQQYSRFKTQTGARGIVSRLNAITRMGVAAAVAGEDRHREERFTRRIFRPEGPQERTVRRGRCARRAATRSDAEIAGREEAPRAGAPAGLLSRPTTPESSGTMAPSPFELLRGQKIDDVLRAVGGGCVGLIEASAAF